MQPLYFQNIPYFHHPVTHATHIPFLPLIQYQNDLFEYQSAANPGTTKKMCEHHIMLFRKCDHDFHATKLCSDVLKHDTCKDPPEHKLPIYSFCGSGGNTEDDWCYGCTPLVLQILGHLAQKGYYGDILEKLTEAEVRRLNPGHISGFWLAGLGAHN